MNFLRASLDFSSKTMVRQVCFYLKINMQIKKEIVHKYLIINILCKKIKKSN